MPIRKSNITYETAGTRGGNVPPKGGVTRRGTKAELESIRNKKKLIDQYPKCKGKTGPARKQCLRDTYGKMGGATGKGKI